jgi:hypothetical protein
VIVDGQVQIFPADPAGVALAASVAGDPVADAIELAQLFNVDVDDLAWMLAFIAANGLGRLKRGETVQAEPAQDAAGGRRRHPDLGGDERGQDERSCRPATPSARAQPIWRRSSA